MRGGKVVLVMRPVGARMSYYGWGTCAEAGLRQGGGKAGCVMATVREGRPVSWGAGGVLRGGGRGVIRREFIFLMAARGRRGV